MEQQPPQCKDVEVREKSEAVYEEFISGMTICTVRFNVKSIEGREILVCQVRFEKE